MSRVGQTVRVRGAVGSLSGARVVSNDYGPAQATGTTWKQTYVRGVHTWDIADEGYFDGVDDLVIPVAGIYLIVAEPSIYGGRAEDMTSGYVEANIRQNGQKIETYAVSFQQLGSQGYVDEPALAWIGSAVSGDRFSMSYTNQTNDEEFVAGGYQSYICALRIA